MRNLLLAVGHWLLAASTKHKTLPLCAKLPEAKGQEPKAKQIPEILKPNITNTKTNKLKQLKQNKLKQTNNSLNY